MEKLAKSLVIFLVLAVLAIPMRGKLLTTDTGVIDLRARMPENGGWSSEIIRGTVNVSLKLRLTSDDVIHSFSVAQTDYPAVEVIPGKFKNVELVFKEPGEYTFYCTRWCGINHWRMRGTIKIEGENPNPINKPDLPEFLKLNIDVDAPRLTATFPVNRPSAISGQNIVEQNPDLVQEWESVWATSPEKLFTRARQTIPADILDDDLVWDMVAWGINQQGVDGWLAQGKTLYRENCLACHGDDGSGMGVMVRDLPPMDHSKMGSEAVRPPDFTDPRVLAGASPALLEGKIIRGGMGTGMPYWGPIFNEDQIRSLVLYLYTFQFDLMELP